jgi:hypothetical protein
MLNESVTYYSRTRTHLGVDKDALFCACSIDTPLRERRFHRWLTLRGLAPTAHAAVLGFF